MTFDNVEISVTGTEWQGLEWIHLAQNSVHWSGYYEYCNEPWGYTKGRNFLTK